MYELELANYGTTQMSFPYMAPCMKWNLWTMEGRTSNFNIWHHVWSGTSALRFYRTRFTGSFSQHCKIRRRSDLLDFHPRFLKCRHRGVFVRARPWIIAYSYSGWTTNTKTSLTVHKSHNEQICPQIFTISAPVLNSYISAYLQAVGHEWLRIPTYHERLIRKRASNCINRTTYRFLRFQPLFLAIT